MCVCVCVSKGREGGRERDREREREREGKRERVTFPSPPFTTTQRPDKHGITALLAAVYEDHEDCVRVLVSSVSQRPQEKIFTTQLLQIPCNLL